MWNKRVLEAAETLAQSIFEFVDPWGPYTRVSLDNQPVEQVQNTPIF